MQKLALIVSILIVLVTIAVPIYEELTVSPPKAAQGTMDLTAWNPGEGTVKLDGEWEFYWERLLKPADFVGGSPVRTGFIQVPTSWDSFRIDGNKLPTYGYATYRLRVLLPESEGVYGLKTSNIRASNRIFVNGKPLGASGSPTESPETIIHRNTPYTGFFELSGREVDIVVQVASFKSFNSGIVQSISLGREHAVSGLDNYYIALDGALASGFFSMALYFFGIYFQRRHSVELLYFAISCLSTTVFVLTHSERILMQLIPEMGIMLQLYIEDISSIMIVASFSRYAYHSFPHLYSRTALRVIDYVSAAGIAAVLFTSASYNGPFIYGLTLYILVVMLVNSYYMLKAILKGVDGALYLVLCIIGVLDFVVVNILNTIWKLDEHYIFPIAQPIILMSQALYMSQTYTSAFRTIQELSRKLSAMDKIKDEFLAKTSHELKTPLNGIINISQSLLDGAGGGLQPGQSDDLRLVRDIGKRLATLVNDILDYSKMKNHDLRLRFTHIDLYMVVNIVMELFRFIVKNKSLTLVNRVPRETYFVYADENRLMQIIYNLVDNAVKYTKTGSITVSAAQKGGFVFISVEDTGIGIPPSKFADIFKSFEQLEPSLTRLHGGVGLGLSITQQLVELHGGSIELKSEEHVGTRMTFSIPLGQREQAERSQPLEEMEPLYGPAPTHPSGPVVYRQTEGTYRILAVDDEYSSLKALINILSLEHYRVTAVGSGEEALKLLRQGESFDLCILDVMMPGLSGYDVCRAIRQQYSVVDLPVLLVTAKTHYNDLAAGFAAGANDFLEKPYDWIELKSRVGTLLQLKRSASELVQREMAFLQAQIKPHFIYNTLNTILSFSYTHHEKSRKLLTDFSLYLRSCFDFKPDDSFVGLEKELGLLKAYVEIEQARFGELLEVEFRIDPQGIPCQIPSLVLQPLVENAIHHGIMKKEDGGKVTVSVVQEEDGLHIEVADNGIGFQPHAGRREESRQGIGLANIDKRLRTLYGSGLNITSAPDEGTVISLDIPMELRSDRQ